MSKKMMRESVLLSVAGILTFAAVTQAAVINVAIQDSKFSPADVGIILGDTVHWEWQGAFPHSTTSAAGFIESWDSGINGSGATFDYVFSNGTGIYPYICSIHGVDNGNGTVGGMSGYIAVFSGSGFELLGPTPGTAGLDNKFAVGGATPGKAVHFVYAFQKGSTNVPGCAGLTVDLKKPQVFGSATADSNGFVTLNVSVPLIAAGKTIYFQTVDLSSCQVSNLVTHTF